VLRRVSDDWLAHKAAAEKGFSLGFFDEAYVRRFPVGVIEVGGAIQAFATLWPGAPGSELSVDLMRFSADAPKNVMEALLVHVMLWGRAEGYRRLSLGMAPLSGFERSAVAPRWQKVGAFVYEHGEAFYGFQGLRAFKEKFAPEWEPRYLACPGGLALPRVLADISALIAGGYRRIFIKAAGPPPGRPSGSVLNFGRYAGWSLGEIGRKDIDYIEWLDRTPIGRQYREEIDAILRAAGRRRSADTDSTERRGLFRRR